MAALPTAGDWNWGIFKVHSNPTIPWEVALGKEIEALVVKTTPWGTLSCGVFRLSPCMIEWNCRERKWCKRNSVLALGVCWWPVARGLNETDESARHEIVLLYCLTGCLYACCLFQMQYSFIYQALLEYYLYGDTELDVSSLEKHLQTSHSAAPNLVKIGLEEEFKVSRKSLCSETFKCQNIHNRKVLQKQNNCNLRRGLSKLKCQLYFLLAVNRSNGLSDGGTFRPTSFDGRFPLCIWFAYKKKNGINLLFLNWVPDQIKLEDGAGLHWPNWRVSSNVNSVTAAGRVNYGEFSHSVLNTHNFQGEKGKKKCFVEKPLMEKQMILDFCDGFLEQTLIMLRKQNFSVLLTILKYLL